MGDIKEKQNAKRLAEWRDFNRLMGSPVEGFPPDAMTEKRIMACMRYTIYLLKKGYVPDVCKVVNTLRGEIPVPKCGAIDCFLKDEDHVH